jgi:hypothetical protein
MKIQPVLTQNVQQVWPLVERFIKSALDFSKGDYDAEHAKVYLSQGHWHLLVAVDDSGDIKGACTIEYINRPNSRVAMITAVGGKFVSTPEVFDQLRNIVKLNGATHIEGAARESIARLWKMKFGFAEKYKIVEVAV